MSNPYRGLPSTSFWRRSMAHVERHLVDPVVATKFHITAGDRVMTAGSCFAQHISRTLAAFGFNYLVTEQGDDLSTAVRRERQYGVYTARYGNLYTVRQLLQLFAECYEGRTPAERVWQRADGRWVDALRPRIEPAGYAKADEVVAARQHHLDCVRQGFDECDVFVFTLGLTECWRSRVDGTIYPLAPGVAGGSFDPSRHEFLNMGVTEVISDLASFLDRLRERNPRVRVVLTVSPVPLIATHEDQHVLAATVYSKSVLRVAAAEMTKSYNWVDYFPSYEIITGNHSAGVYYADDLREVNHLGVAHAMRCFRKHYMQADQSAPATVASSAGNNGAWANAAGSDVVCDEEAIEQSVRSK